MTKLRFLAVLVIVFFIFSSLSPCFAETGESSAGGSALSDTEAAADAPEITIAAKAALLVDADTGTVLLDQDANEKLYPASLTKIMTCMLALDYGNLDDELTVSATALQNLSIYGSTADLIEGETMTLENMLYCMMIESANEACNVIGEYVSGSVSAFVDLMNRKAQELGCENTHFANSNGLHDENHYTTARDLYKIVREAMKNETFMEICNTASKEIPPTNKSGTRYLMTTNYLLSEQKISGYFYQYARGIKTGFTTPAGHCLISSAEKNGVSLISVVLGAETVVRDDGTTDLQNFSETRRLFEWGFDNFQKTTVISASDPIAQVPVNMASESDSIIVHADHDVTAIMPKTYDKEKVVTEIKIFGADTNGDGVNELEAPVKQDAEVGEMTVSYNGKTLDSVKLLALTGVDRSQIMYKYQRFKDFFAQAWVKLVLIGLVALAFIVSVTSFSYSLQKQKRKAALGSTYKGSSRKIQK